MAAESLKFRISRAISTTFHSCRSKDPSILPQEPIPLPVPKLIADANIPPPAPPSLRSRSSSGRRHHVSSAVISVGCGFSSKSDVTQDPKGTRKSQEFKWQKEEKWHVVASIYEETQTPRHKIHNSSASGGNSDDDEILLALPPRPPKSRIERKKSLRANKTKVPAARLRMSTSSADSGLFSSSELGDERGEEEKEEEEDETETEGLMTSSRSFSADSSSEFFNTHLQTIRQTSFSRRHRSRKIRTSKKQSTRVPFKENMIYRPSSVSSAAEGGESPARLSVFKKLIPCSVDGKVKESFAVMKKSKDPYEDFKRSMMEMILEKQMFEERELEQLLQCFLSLNAKNYHGLIVEAFTEIWQDMFSYSSARHSATHSRVNSFSRAF